MISGRFGSGVADADHGQLVRFGSRTPLSLAIPINKLLRDKDLRRPVRTPAKRSGSAPVLDVDGSGAYITNDMKCSVTTAVRGRPREFDPDEALAAALRVFWQNGYEGTSMTDLTEAMGITKPSLYACFGNKEALFRKALDLYERDKLAYIGKALEEPTAKTVAERLLRGALATHCGGSDPQGCLGVIATVAGCAEAVSIREHVCARRASSELALVERFERAKAEGDLPDSIEPKALGSCVTTVLQGLSVKAQSGATRAELDASVDAFLAMWPGR